MLGRGAEGISKIVFFSSPDVMQTSTQWRIWGARRPSIGLAVPNVIESNHVKKIPPGKVSCSDAAALKAGTGRRRSGGRRPSTGPAFPSVTERNHWETAFVGQILARSLLEPDLGNLAPSSWLLQFASDIIGKQHFEAKAWPGAFRS